MKSFLALLTFLLTETAFAYITVSPAWVDFGDISVDRTIGRTASIWVRNQVERATHVSVTDTCFSEFRLSHTCNYLSPYASCYVRVIFTPRRLGYQSCTIRVRTSEGHFATVNIRGRGVEDRAFEVQEMYTRD